MSSLSWIRGAIERYWLALAAVSGRRYLRKRVRLGSVKLMVGRWPGMGGRVLLIHGLTGNHLAWQGIAASLRGLDLHAPDLRGRGLSDHPAGPYGAPMHAEDLAQYLSLVGPAAVVGHSFGAIVGLELALRYPHLVRRLVLLDGGAPMLPVQKLKVMSFLLKSLERIGPLYKSPAHYLRAARESPIITEWSRVLEEHLLYELVPEGRRLRCAILPATMEQELVALGGSLRPGRIAMRWLKSPVESWTMLRRQFPYERISCPVLVVKAGKQNLQPGDDLVSYRALREILLRIPNARGVVLPALNHYEMVLKNDPDRDALVRAFLAVRQVPG